MNYDPERELWLPSRRKFFFFGLAAGVAPFLPELSAAVAAHELSYTVRIGLQTFKVVRAFVDGQMVPFETTVNGIAIPPPVDITLAAPAESPSAGTRIVATRPDVSCYVTEIKLRRL